jgi:hypothetical protein
MEACLEEKTRMMATATSDLNASETVCLDD